MAEPKTVVVVGGGFAGCALIARLSALARGLKIILVDPRRESVFLPLLPDVVAGRLSPERLLFPLGEFCRRRADFINRKAEHLSGTRALVLDDGRELPFDYLALAAGMEPNFYGDERAAKIAFPLAGKEDARLLEERLEAVMKDGRPHIFLVAGGGYTGVETATALVRRSAEKKDSPPFRIRIMEPAPRILGNLPDRIAALVRREVARLGIEVSLSARLEIGERDEVRINGELLRDLTLIWSAGMRTVGLIRGLDFPKDKQGRLRVGPDLSLPGAEHIFALGDCGRFETPSGPLRPAVQFSWAEGRAAAENIVRRIKGAPPLEYRPRDYGYLIPVASGRAWGEVGGARVGGRLGSALHYFMCIYRTWSRRNKIGIIKDLLKNRAAG